MLIAEIGNLHLGQMIIAKEMIRAAIDSGADLIKAQAIDAELVSKVGSMPKSFYETCQLKEEEYIELIEYARELGSDLFYSYFSTDTNLLKVIANYHKISASQAAEIDTSLKAYDLPNYFISYGIDHRTVVSMKKAQVMFATPYLSKGEFFYLDNLKRLLNRKVGLSDHSIGIGNCLKAVKLYGVELIEKHFCLDYQKDNIYYANGKFRDCIHSATPKEFKEIAKYIKGSK